MSTAKRKRRWRKKDMCGTEVRRKTFFFTRERAEEYREWLGSARGAYLPQLRAYRCPWCGRWHVGHVPGSRRRV